MLARLARARSRRHGHRRASATWSTTCPTDRSTSCSSPTTRCSTWRPPSASGPASPPSPRGWRPAARSSSRRSCPRTRRDRAPSSRVRSMTADEVVLSISEHDPATQRADGQFVAVRRRRAGAAAAVVDPLRDAGRARRDGRRRRASSLAERWEDFDRHPFERRQPAARHRVRADQVTFGTRPAPIRARSHRACVS